MPGAPPAPEPLAARAAARTGDALWFQATAIAVEGQGILILGPSGSGKSSLALDLMALGATLIADDGLWLHDAQDPPRLVRPTHAPDLIEARGIGLLKAGATLACAPLALVVDLSQAEPDRLPQRRLVAVGPGTRPLICGAGHPRLAPALVLMARHGRAEP